MLRLLVLVVVALMPVHTALAQAYPSRPIRVVVPWPAGGGTDVVTRLVTQKMATTLGQPIVIENRAGAGGSVGIEVVSKAPADGYTLVIATAGAAINHSLSKNLSFSIVRDFDPVVILAFNQGVLVVNPSFPAQSIAELIAQARARPGAFTYGSNGPGSATHLWTELFAMKTGTRLLHVPYKGAAPALADLLGGQIQMLFVDMAVALPQIRAGKLKALGVGMPNRFEGLPEVPTIAESGVAGYEARSFTGLMAPAGTPREAIGAVHAAAAGALADPSVRQGLLALAAIPVGESPEYFARLLRREVEQWASVIEAARIEIQ